MPEPAKSWAEERDVEAVQHSLMNILNAYQRDFSKHADGRPCEYEDALQWLCDAGLVRKIYRSSAPGLPISSYDDMGAFKIYLADVGILRRLFLLAPQAFQDIGRWTIRATKSIFWSSTKTKSSLSK